ncbi:MAG: hypothetical protein HC794_06690 [Nitrospiraceae bacterium]|nr:hypothetical protein [Nitrospiraceae bacterium]
MQALVTALHQRLEAQRFDRRNAADALHQKVVALDVRFARDGPSRS